MQRPHPSTGCNLAASQSSVSSGLTWQVVLGRTRLALRAAWFAGILAATALAGAAPGVIDVR